MIQCTMITINGLHRQLVYDIERYNDTMNNDNDGNPVIGPRDWKQQKLRRGFKQNSAIYLQTFSSQKGSRHPPLAGKILPIQPWQNCLYIWYLIQHNWWITYHIKLSAMNKYKLILYDRSCSSYNFFLRAVRLSNKFLWQGYVKEHLR